MSSCPFSLCLSLPLSLLSLADRQMRNQKVAQTISKVRQTEGHGQGQGQGQGQGRVEDASAGRRTWVTGRRQLLQMALLLLLLLLLLLS